MKVKPITPNEVLNVRQESIPDAVIEAFNELITENWSSQFRGAVVLQDDAVKRIVKKLKIKREAVFDNGYLDVEPIFENAGWVVEFDKPGYNESYEANFTFSRK